MALNEEHKLVLKDDISERRREIMTDSYAMSIGEVLSMYRDGDIDIHPEFQRIFRWNGTQKSRLVESILLGIPIPPIFVSQRDDGIWDVIDGVQRLSTVLEFVGLYEDEDKNRVPMPILMATEYLPSLEGIKYEAEDDSDHAFDDVLRRDFKRSKLGFVIVRKESDKDAKYDLFQRLNAGTGLSAQEARNCLLVMIDRTFYEWIVQLSNGEHFQRSVLLSQRKEDEGFRQELVLRFLLHLRYDGGTSELHKEHGEFLTDWIRGQAESDEMDRTAVAQLFNNSFEVIDSALSDSAFRRWDEEQARFLGPFSISAFEAITSGVVGNVSDWQSRDSDELIGRIKAMWGQEGFRGNSGTGVSTRRRLPKLIHFGREYFSLG